MEHVPFARSLRSSARHAAYTSAMPPIKNVSKRSRRRATALAVAMCMSLALAGGEIRADSLDSAPPVIDCASCRETNWADVALGAGLLAGVALIARWKRGAPSA